MNLHRTTGKPDWETIRVSDRTFIQNIAAATKGVVTPPNIISVIGLGLVIYGLAALFQGQYLFGIILLAVGRLLDIADGLVADVTGTKSPIGELTDATIDKIGTLLTIITLVIVGIAPLWLITLLLVPQLAISSVILYKRHKGTTVHPTLVGKLSMALVWAAITGLLLLKAFALGAVVISLVYTAVIFSALLAVVALWQYSTGRG